MADEQKKRIKNRLTLMTFGVVVLLAILLIVLVMTKKINTIWFPLGAGMLLGLYWVVADVLPVVWLRLFEDKTDAQKRSYYIYAAIDAVGLGGLLYFIMSMSSITGALIYVASVLFKKRFYDEYLGVSESEDEQTDIREIGSEAEETEPGDVSAVEEAESEDASAVEEAKSEESSEAKESESETVSGEETGK